MLRQLPVLVVLVATFLLALPGSTAALPRGDCSAEPGLAGRTDIVFCEPWENAEWWQNGYVKSARLQNPIPARAGDVGKTSIESSGCVSGKCLRVSMKQFVSDSMNIHWLLNNADLQPQQLYMRYYLKLGPTWNNDNCRDEGGKAVYEDAGGKFPGLADPRDTADPTGQCGNGGQPGDGINCWSHRTGFRNCYGGSTSNQICKTVPGGITRYYGYLYFVGQEGTTGNPGLWDHDPWGQFTGRGGTCATEPTNLFCAKGRNLGVLVRERWYALEHFIKMNTPGVADGVIRGWVDGKLAYEKTNMIFRVPGHNNLHVRTAWLNVYKGGLYGGCNDSEIWLDQMVLVTDAPIGPLPVRPQAPQR